MIIKIFLIGSVIAASWWLLLGQRSARRLALTRLAGAAFTLSWIVGVLAPGLVTRVANVVGVVRGTDLVLYVLVVAFTFSTIAQRLRARELEDRIARLTRAQTLLEADVRNVAQLSAHDSRV